MLFNGRALIFTFSGTQVRIAEIERLQSLFKTSMLRTNPVCLTGCRPPPLLQGVRRCDGGGWHRLDADDREHAGRPAVRLHPVRRRLPRPAHRGRLPAGDPLEPRQRARESRLSEPMWRVLAHVASPQYHSETHLTQLKHLIANKKTNKKLFFIFNQLTIFVSSDLS